MKRLIVALFVVVPAFGQSPEGAKVVTFNRADAEHCKVVMAAGKLMLETTYEGTTVAVTVPQNWGNGEFSVLVAVAQTGPGQAQVNPRAISALYSDAAHTRLVWFDKGLELDTENSRRAAGLGGPGMQGGPGGPGGGSGVGDSSSAMPPPNHPEAMAQMDPHVGTRSDEESRQLQMRNAPGGGGDLPKLDPAHPPTFLRMATLKQGAKAAGYVFLRRPKGSKVQVTAVGTLDEIDVPVNGVVFRF